jgi:hypothetical protein
MMTNSLDGDNRAASVRDQAAVPRGPKAWLLALRPWSFPASIIPMLVGGALAYRADFWDWPLFLLTLVGGLFFHIGANVTNTYFDFRRGADTVAHADDRTLVDSILRPRDVLLLTGVFFLAGAAIGGYLVSQSGWQLLTLGAVGLFLGLFYTADPLGYKYRALGDLGIFISFGPLLVLGSYFVQTEKLDLLPLLFSLPLGLLIVAIVHANNYRDAQAPRLEVCLLPPGANALRLCHSLRGGCYSLGVACPSHNRAALEDDPPVERRRRGAAASPGFPASADSQSHRRLRGVDGRWYSWKRAPMMCAPACLPVGSSRTGVRQR